MRALLAFAFALEVSDVSLPPRNGGSTCSPSAGVSSIIR